MPVQDTGLAGWGFDEAQDIETNRQPLPFPVSESQVSFLGVGSYRLTLCIILTVLGFKSQTGG